jgi:hypothetical protein
VDAVPIELVDQCDASPEYDIGPDKSRTCNSGNTVVSEQVPAYALVVLLRMLAHCRYRPDSLNLL